MAIREVIQEGNLTLRKKAREVTIFDWKLHQLLDDMVETMVAEDGVGLAAPQIGILRRIFVMDDGVHGLVECINPQVLYVEGEQECLEGCLSCPTVKGLVTRPLIVEMKAQDRDGEYFNMTLEGFPAVVFCHEFDHLEGVLFVDIASKQFTDQELLKYFAEHRDLYPEED